MTPIDLQNRAQYLSLALFSQKVISALMEYVDEDKRVRLKPSLKEALVSLQHSKRLPSPSQRKVAAFTSYEHLRTLEEVWSSKRRDKAMRMMRVVLHAPKSPKTKTAANELIGLFSDLQNQALWNFEQPKPVSRKVMQRLCQQA
jgi:hypothetical protein